MSTMKSKARMIAVLVVLFACSDLTTHSQQRPNEDSKDTCELPESATLEGQLIYHDGMRKWFELKLDKPLCGQPSVELFPGRSLFYSGRPSALETFRGCRIRTDGSLGGAASGYYTLDVNQMVGEIESTGKCTRQPPLPDYSKVKPDKSVRKFRVEMTVDYEQEDRPIYFRVTSEGKELHPWQAYASYFLTGGYVLYCQCAKGFMVDQVFGDPVAGPQHLEARGDPFDPAMFGPPEGPAGESYKKKLHLGYTCMRKP